MTLRIALVWLLGLCNLVSASRALADQDGLLGYWKCDAGQGDVVVDSSGNDNDGEIWGAEWVRGEFGTALRFDGSGGYVAIPELAGLDGSDQLTVEAWIYWEGAGRYPNILTGGTWSPGGFMLFVSDHQCSFRMGRPGASAARGPTQWRETSAPVLTPFAYGKWYHVAATFQRPVIKTYVNGRQVGSAKWDYPIGYKGDIIIGKWAGAISHKGLIDEVRIFNRALGADDIAASYRRQSPRRKSVPDGQKAYERIPRSLQVATAAAVLENECAKLIISRQGRCTGLVDKSTGEDRILRTSPLLTIQQQGKVFNRSTCSFEQGKLIFRFGRAKTTVTLRVVTKPKYFTFHLDSVSSSDAAGPPSNTEHARVRSAPVGSTSNLDTRRAQATDATSNVEQVTLMRLHLKPCDNVDRMSGLAATATFGVCLRSLNPRTHVVVSGKEPVLTATTLKGHSLHGAGVALVACATSRLRPVLRDVMRDESLPYSPLGGPFARDAQEIRSSYVFATVSEKNVDQWIELARRGGIRYIHLSGWQSSLGHYQPREALFPHGLDGLKTVAGKIHTAGLKVGIHTLTGCISTNDPWLRPVPHPDLATDGTYHLASDLSDKDLDVPTTESPGDHPTIWAYGSRGNCIRIDDELIQYSVINKDAPRGFRKCKRGAFGTKVAAHKKGAAVHHMYVRYGCFVPDENGSLVDDVADAIANVYNTCGIDQIYMDGAEAMRGWYGIGRMRRAIFTRLKRPALVEASCWDHQSWPFHSRIGAWDHPKWGLKRFADEHLRAVEHYRNASLLEAQLGWWVILGPARDWHMEMPDEIEYLCAKALGHDVPLSFQGVAVTSAPPNARQDEYFTTIGRYERLRLANYFSDAVKQELRQERQEFQLEQAADGQWQFIPADYLQHKVTGPHNGTSEWSVANRYATQPLKMRIESLYSALPFNDSDAMVLADFIDDDEFVPAGAAAKVRYSMRTTTKQRKAGKSSLELTATNDGDSPVGAWARVVKTFDPVVNMTPYDAIGLWVYGDGKGELLNIQLTNLPEYFHTRDDHHIKVDFTGWRYFELLMRERDAAGYHDYKWPYGAHCVLHRNPLVRHAVSKMTIYLNNLPPDQEVKCYLSPIKALRTRNVTLNNPVIEAAGKRLMFPVALKSGMYIEFDSMADCRLYDDHGNLLRRLRAEGDVPTLASGDNRLTFTCEGPKLLNSRAEVTVITNGQPLQGRMPRDQVDWSLLRREYDKPRTIYSLDPAESQWQVSCRPGVEYADVRLELSVDSVGNKMDTYESPATLTLESFETPAGKTRTPDSSGTFAYDSQQRATGCSKGVRQQLARSMDVVKIGQASGRYTAVSTRPDDGGWSYTNKTFKKPIDLSKCAAIGFWLHGDGKGEQFKLQLRDALGGWRDMYIKVDFRGWRYCQFPLASPRLKAPDKILAVSLYYNGIPGGQTVTCHVDELRALPEAEPLRNPTFAIGGNQLQFPVALHPGDRLVLKRLEDCKVHRKSGTIESVRPVGITPKLKPGANTVRFSLPTPQPKAFRIQVSLTKVYPQAK